MSIETVASLTAKMDALENSGKPYEEVADEYEALSARRTALRPVPKASASLKRHMKAIRNGSPTSIRCL